MAPAATIVSRNKMPPSMAATITQGKAIPVSIKQDKRQHTGASHSQIPALFEVEAKWIHEDASGITSSWNAHWWRPSNTQRGPTGEVPTFMAILMSGVWDADARWRAGRLWILKRSCHTKRHDGSMSPPPGPPSQMQHSFKARWSNFGTR